MQNNRLVVIVLLAVFSLAGCAGRSESQSFVRDNVDFGFYRRVAVLPFSNNTGEANADERIRHITTTQLLSLGFFEEVVDSGVVDGVLRDEALDPTAFIEAASLERLGQLLNVEAFLLGSVDDISSGQRGSFAYPSVTLTMRLLDPKGATVLWQANGHRSGYSLTGRLLGLESSDEYQISAALVRQLLSEGLSK